MQVEGMVYTDATVDQTCAELTAPQHRPEELSGIELIFVPEGASGDAASAVTGALETEDLDYGCRFLARYQVTLERAGSYSVSFVTPEPRVFGGAYFTGTEHLEEQRRTLEQLEENGLRWDFEVPPEWAVP